MRAEGSQGNKIASKLFKFHETSIASLTFSPPEYCRLRAEKKTAYGVKLRTGMEAKTKV